ncbi:MAG TPA: UDP-2,4-diacetamido-2,4,6-trideoxy-beta-L-altropyranose hydrolase [Phenylobacterium sp.]|nr:UDP-2,4-diacetamido-2,4,6-trideoxy-beta-L-altropyranose hydrolase [Phenylobacterium sp.]
MIPSEPRILFIANAGPQIGGGHVMRSLTLAGALAERGGLCTFAASPAVGAILDVFGPDFPREDATSLDPEALVDTVTGVQFDAVVFDHYGLGRGEHKTLADGRPTLIIDDLADRPLGGDIVVDAGPDRRPMDYTLLVDEQTRLLLGPEYAPVRPQFAALRAEALNRRGGPVGRILVALGLTDLGGLTAKVVDRLRPRLGAATLDVVLGGQAPSLKSLSRIAAHDPRLTLHVDTTDMASLMAAADIAVSAAGSTIWEACTLGLPSVLTVIAENQRPAALSLAARDAALVLDGWADDFDAAFDRTLVRLMNDAPMRARLAANSAQICDGQGAGRVADAFMALISERAAR